MLRNTLLVVGAIAPFSLAGLFVSSGENSSVEPNAATKNVVFASCCAPEAEAAAEPVEPTNIQDGARGDAVVKGKVRFDGEAPKRDAVDMKADGICVKAHETPVLKEDVIVGKEGAFKNVFVYVKKGIEGKYEAPKEAVTVDQKGCVYIPHVFGIVAGQKINIKNSDATTHNVHSYGKKNKAINQGQPPGAGDLSVEWKASEMSLWIKCDMHSWMSTICHVMKHPFFTVTDDNGMFEIKGLPAGKYTIAAIHETLGEQTVEVEVAAKDSKDANFTFSAKK
ncbi:MAG: hypothetical protein ACKVS6_11225 [Planctomycetota bacterium]